MRANPAVILFAALAACRGSEPVRAELASSPPPPTSDAAVPVHELTHTPPCEGCEPFLIANLPTARGTSIALDGAGFAYVATFFDDAIFRVPLQRDAKPSLLYHSPGANLGDIEVHGDELRWSSNATGRIYAAPKSGAGPIRILAETQPGIWGFVSDEDWIYWADFGGSAPGTIWKKPLRGGPSVAIARDLHSPLADHVVIASGSDLLYTEETGRILRVATDGGEPEVWASVPDDYMLSGVTLDKRDAYVSTLNGRLLRIDRESRAAEIFATAPESPSRVAVDDTYVYWVTYTPVAVWGKRKPR